MFLHSVEFGLDKEYDHAIFEAFFARECFSDFLQVRGFKRCSRCRFHAERKLAFESAERGERVGRTWRASMRTMRKKKTRRTRTKKMR